ncbi:MAG: CoA transferase [Chloroflexi bacterium]|nr:CoA transferase [Chloroflexota bacterium]
MPDVDSLPTPLDGIKVLDCSQILAGPYCSMLLADMGADVVKIEKPSGGDDTRRMGPPFLEGESAAFLAMNRNKRSVVLDFKNADGVAAMRRMLADADVIIENYRAGVMGRLGLDYDAVRELNPGIIYCSISGFGRTGPYAERAGFDLIAQGMSGVMSFTGIPGSPPVKVGVPMADLNAGLYSAYGILSAYIHKLKSGEGQYLEVSIMEAALAYTVWESASYFATGNVPPPLGSAHRLSAPYQALRTADGHITIGAPNQSNWERLCKAMGREDLLDDERYADNAGRLLNRESLERDLEETFGKRSTREWCEVLDASGVPAGPIYDMEQVWADEQVQARGMDVTLEHPKVGSIRNIGLAAKLYGSPGRIHSPAPLMGQHTREVLAESGFNETEIEGLIASGAAQAG